MSFQPGDHVVYKPKQVDATVMRELGNDQYVIEFDDDDLIPPQMTVPGVALEFVISPLLYGGYNPSPPKALRKSFYSKETHCPKCDNPWTVTQGFNEPYYDCLKCNIKRENA